MALSKEERGFVGGVVSQVGFNLEMIVVDSVWYRVGPTCSEVKRTSRGAAAMPLVLTSGKNLYLAIITLYMFEMAPPA